MNFLKEWLPLIISTISVLWMIVSFFILFSQNKKYELLRNKLDKNKHISNTQFDLEITIYKELTSQLFEVYLKVFEMFPTNMIGSRDKSDETSYHKSIHQDASETYVKFQNTLSSYEPFIHEEIFSLFEDIRVDILSQIVHYPKYINDKKNDELSPKENIEYFQKTEKISDKRRNIVLIIRKHLNELKTKTI